MRARPVKHRIIFNLRLHLTGAVAIISCGLKPLNFDSKMDLNLVTYGRQPSIILNDSRCINALGSLIVQDHILSPTLNKASSRHKNGVKHLIITLTLSYNIFIARSIDRYLQSSLVLVYRNGLTALMYNLDTRSIKELIVFMATLSLFLIMARA